MFRGNQSKNLKRRRERNEPTQSSRTNQSPLSPGKGRAGGLVRSDSSLGAYVRKMEKVDKDVDPREALLKYAKSASDNPYWVAPAYQGEEMFTLLK